MSRILIVGCGDIGLRVAALHNAAGDEVVGVVRSQSSALRMSDAGIQAVIADLDLSGLLAPAGRFDVVYHFMPPPPHGDHDSRTEALLSTLPPFPRLVYMSTTSVYGDHGGGWVDENTPVNPSSQRGRRRVDAEHQLMSWGVANGVSVIILRVAAIYGPGRLPLQRLREGAVAVRPEEAPPTNRIHADDLAAVCFAAARQAHHGDIFNCADGAPSSQAEFLMTLSKLAGTPPPKLIAARDAESMLPASMLEFLSDSKRIRAERIRKVLGVELRNPDHESGLRSSLAVSDQG